MTEQPLKRQPDQIYIVPSKPNAWYGDWNEGERFSGYQLLAMRSLDLDPATVEVITVRRQATDREMWWPIGSPPPVFAFECPVIHRRADGKVRVIAPAGMVKLVRADGWAGFPCRENWLRFKDASAVPAGSAGASVSPAPADAEVGRGNQPEQPR